jgi:hypothetical protein
MVAYTLRTVILYTTTITYALCRQIAVMASEYVDSRHLTSCHSTAYLISHLCHEREVADRSAVFPVELTHSARATSQPV